MRPISLARCLMAVQRLSPNIGWTPISHFTW